MRILQLLGYTSGGLPDDFDELGEGESEDSVIVQVIALPVGREVDRLGDVSLPRHLQLSHHSVRFVLREIVVGLEVDPQLRRGAERLRK